MTPIPTPARDRLLCCCAAAGLAHDAALLALAEYRSELDALHRPLTQAQAALVAECSVKTIQGALVRGELVRPLTRAQLAAWQPRPIGRPIRNQGEAATARRVEYQATRAKTRRREATL